MNQESNIMNFKYIFIRIIETLSLILIIPIFLSYEVIFLWELIHYPMELIPKDILIIKLIFGVVAIIVIFFVVGVELLFTGAVVLESYERKFSIFHILKNYKMYKR